MTIPTLAATAVGLARFAEPRAAIEAHQAGISERLAAFLDAAGPMLAYRTRRRAPVVSPAGEQEGASAMSLTRMTAKQIAAAGAGQVDRARLDATTEADIRRHMIEDGEDPDAEPRFEKPVLPQDLRRKLGLTQTGFATLLGIPVATVRNWEQNHFVMEPAARTLLKLVDREPQATLRAPRAA